MTPLLNPQRTVKQTMFLVAAAVLVMLCSAGPARDAGANSPSVNAPAPHFSVELGAGQVLTSEMLRGVRWWSCFTKYGTS